MPARRRGRADARSTFYALTALATFCYATTGTVSVVYMVTVVRLDPLQLVLVGTLLELTCFLFEVPTGAVADLRSRRLSVIIGFVLIGLGFGLQGLVPTFAAVLAAQVLWGVGYTFTSGAAEAWITDEVGVDQIAAIFTAEQRIAIVAGMLGTIVAGGLSLISIRLPLAIGGVGFLLLAIGLALRMPENGFRPTPVERRETVAHLVSTVAKGLRLARQSRVVGGLLAISVITGLASEAYDRLWQTQLINDVGLPRWAGVDSPGTWFALFGLVGSLIALAASLAYGRLARNHSPHSPGRVLAVLAGVDVVGTLGVALAGSLPLAIAAVWLKKVAFTIAQPLLDTWLNRQLTSDVRATVLSMNGQANAIGQVVGGPPLGLLGSRTRPAVAIVASAVIASPVVAIYLRLNRPA